VQGSRVRGPIPNNNFSGGNTEALVWSQRGVYTISTGFLTAAKPMSLTRISSVFESANSSKRGKVFQLQT